MKNWIINHKILFLFLFFLLMVLGGVLFFVISSQIVVIVDMRPIWKSDFNDTVHLMVKYYDAPSHNASTAIEESDILEDEDFLKRVQKEALFKMIEYKVIVLELEKVDPNWKKNVKAKIDEALKSRKKENLSEGIEMLYDMNFNDFESKVLLPQAQYELLVEKLKNQKEVPKKKLEDLIKKANVRILLDDFKWKDGEVIIAH